MIPMTAFLTSKKRSIFYEANYFSLNSFSEEIQREGAEQQWHVAQRTVFSSWK